MRAAACHTSHLPLYITFSVGILNVRSNQQSIFHLLSLFSRYRMFGMLCNKSFSGEVYIADPYIDGKLM